MTTKSNTRSRGRSASATAPRAQVLVIGGGINGIGTFRDLALQGVDVVLVERNDFVSGASAASSHMIHGGIRYLENGEFRLVKESVHERNGLLKIAPHYVKPLQTTIPIFSTFSGILAAPLRFLTHKQGKPKERGAFLIKIGLTIYDSFSRDGGTVPRHQFHGRKKSLAELPAAEPGRQVHRHLLRRLRARPGAPRARRARRRARRPGRTPARSTTSRRSARATAASCCATARPARSSPSTPTSSSTPPARGPTSPTTPSATTTPLHGRHQGLAHRARQPRAARGLRRAARCSSRTTTAASC